MPPTGLSLTAACNLAAAATLALAALATPAARAEASDLRAILEDCRVSAGQAFPSTRARCGTFERPVNPDDPDSPTIELSFAIVPALNLEPLPDPVVPLAGGPGQSAVDFYSGYSWAFETLRRDRDILLLDQRGTGDSARMDCPLDLEVAAGDPSTAETVRYTRECLESLPHDPRWFTTSIAVRDLEALRVALGYPELNLYGVSYGSRVAQHYARRYPDSTRTVVLDGVVAPQLPLGPEIATEAQVALNRIFARCAEDAACNEAFPALATRFAEFKARLAEKPVNVKVADPVTGEFSTLAFGPNEMAAAIRLLAYDSGTIAILPLLLSEAADGNYRPLAAQYQMTVSAMADAIALGMHNAVMCSEDVPYYDDSLIDEPALAASYMGTIQLEALRAMCGVWPEGPVDADFHEPLATRAPVLLLSGDSDPITPPRYADMAAMNLMRAWLLTGRNQGHGQLGVGCMPRIIAGFVANASLEPVDTGCMAANFAMPFFLDYGGPAP
jgi:pimeloyl-ACP methyl ester carboxylesterase